MGLLGSLTVAAAIGLWFQCAMLLRSARGTIGPQRFALMIAIAWRWGVLGLLAACFVVRFLLDRQILKDNSQKLDNYCGPVFPDLIWTLCIVVVAGSVARRRRTSPPVRWRPLINFGLAVAAAALAVLILSDITLITYLVYIAVSGIERHEPLAFQRPGAYPSSAAEGFRLFWVSVAGAAAAWTAAVALVWASHRSGGWRRAIQSFLLIAGIGGATAYSVWFHFWALPTFAPDFANVGMQLSWSESFSIAAILVGLVTWLTIRMATGNGQSDCGESVVWRPTDVRFLHEGLWFAIATLTCAAWYFIDFIRDTSASSGSPFWSPDWKDYVRWSLTWLPNYFWLAILIFSARSILSRRRDLETELQPVSAGRFAIFFITTLLVVVSGVGATYGFVFCWWLGPWYEWPWPEWFV